jgi:hypothetical protein
LTKRTKKYMKYPEGLKMKLKEKIIDFIEDVIWIPLGIICMLLMMLGIGIMMTIEWFEQKLESA